MTPTEQPRVILAGGGFDPPHLRHLAMINRAVDLYQPKYAYLIPSGVKRGCLPGHIRARMCRLAIGRNRRLKLCTYEVDNPGAVSLDTMAYLRQVEGPDVAFDFLVGEDNLNTLVNYNRRTEFLSACRLIVCPRQSREPVDVLKARWQAMLPDAADLQVLDFPGDDLSSTTLRKYAAAKQSLRYLVPPSVDRYIKRHKLYQNPQRPLPVHKGVLYGFFETGTEGVIWSLIKDGVTGYEALYELHKGDHLTVYNQDNSIIWEGIINPEHKTGWQRYPRNPKHGQQCALGMWVHWNQRGFKNIDDWAEMFFAGKLKKNNRYQGPLRAVVVENLSGLQRREF